MTFFAHVTTVNFDRTSVDHGTTVRLDLPAISLPTLASRDSKQSGSCDDWAVARRSASGLKSTAAIKIRRRPLWVVLCRMAPSDVRCRGHLLGAESSEMCASPAQKSARLATLWGQAWPSYGAQRNFEVLNGPACCNKQLVDRLPGLLFWRHCTRASCFAPV